MLRKYVYLHAYTHTHTHTHTLAALLMLLLIFSVSPLEWRDYSKYEPCSVLHMTWPYQMLLLRRMHSRAWSQDCSRVYGGERELRTHNHWLITIILWLLFMYIRSTEISVLSYRHLSHLTVITYTCVLLYVHLLFCFVCTYALLLWCIIWFFCTTGSVRGKKFSVQITCM